MLNILWHSKYVEDMCFASCFHNMNPSPAPHFATKTCVVPRRHSPSTASRTAARRSSRSLRSANHACDGVSQQSAIFMPFLMGKNSWSKEVKLPTIWTDGKEEVGRVREEKRREEKRRSKKSKEDQRRSKKIKEDQRRSRVRGKKVQVREKVEKSRVTVFFP